MLIDALRDLLERLTITNLRQIMAADPDYPWKPDGTPSGCLILSEFPDSAEPFTVPEIVVGQALYTLNQQGLFNNFYGEVRDSTGALTGYRYGLQVPFSIPVSVLSTAKDESSRIAATLGHYCHMLYLRLFTGKGMRIQTAQPGQTVPRDQYPSPRFETVLGLGGVAYWVATVTPGAGVPQLRDIQQSQVVYVGPRNG